MRGTRHLSTRAVLAQVDGATPGLGDYDLMSLCSFANWHCSITYSMYSHEHRAQHIYSVSSPTTAAPRFHVLLQGDVGKRM